MPTPVERTTVRERIVERTAGWHRGERRARARVGVRNAHRREWCSFNPVLFPAEHRVRSACGWSRGKDEVETFEGLVAVVDNRLVLGARDRGAHSGFVVELHDRDHFGAVVAGEVVDAHELGGERAAASIMIGTATLPYAA